MSAEVRREVERQLISEDKYDIGQINEAIDSVWDQTIQSLAQHVKRMKEIAQAENRKISKKDIALLHIKILRDNINKHMSLSQELDEQEMPIPLKKGSVKFGYVPGIKLPPTAGSASTPTPTKSSVSNINDLISALTSLKTGPPEHDILRHRTFQISSSDRDYLSFTDPNDFDYKFEIENRPINFWRVELLEALVSSAFTFFTRPNGYDFFIYLEDVPRTHVIQSYKQGLTAHFKCRSFVDPVTSNVSIDILNKAIILEKPSSSIDTLHVRILNESKQPLTVPQDIYTITNIIQVTSPNRTRLTIGSHSISSGDAIRILGVTVVGDTEFFNESKEFKAIVISTTQIEVDQYRAGVTYTLDNPRVVVLPNAIKLSFRFSFIDSPLITE